MDKKKLIDSKSTLQSPTTLPNFTASVQLMNEMPGNGQSSVPTTPGTPNTKVKDGTGRLKIVVALYPFKAIETGDLSLEKVKPQNWLVNYLK
jgi:tyrosine-protein kinase Tec